MNKISICLEQYDMSEHKAHVLVPCYHTICEKCSNYLLQDTIDCLNKRCYVCRTEVFKSGINYALLDIISYHVIFFFIIIYYLK
jgi:hypothetical protein